MCMNYGVRTMNFDDGFLIVTSDLSISILANLIAFQIEFFHCLPWNRSSFITYAEIAVPFTCIITQIFITSKQVESI